VNYFKELFKNFIGPILVAATLIYGYWSYATIRNQNAALEIMRSQAQEMALALSGKCQKILIDQGYTVEKIEETEEEK
jgi:hypothetical protein